VFFSMVTEFPRSRFGRPERAPECPNTPRTPTERAYDPLRDDPRFHDLIAADEPGALDQPRRHFTQISSLPLLGLEYFHDYLDRYPAKEQTLRSLRGLCPKCAR